jgi:hypothetical protein
MRLEDKQEQLSLAALHAVCAKAGLGYKCSARIQDNWGWDAHADVFERLDPESVLTDFKIKFQLKATRQTLTLKNGRLSFPIEVSHYNRLRASGRSDAPTYLVVFHLPGSEADWLECTPEQLVLRRCLRWVSLRNAPETANQTITVYVPEKNVLTPDALRELAKARSLEKWIDYVADTDI